MLVAVLGVPAALALAVAQVLAAHAAAVGGTRKPGQAIQQLLSFAVHLLSPHRPLGLPYGKDGSEIRETRGALCSSFYSG